MSSWRSRVLNPLKILAVTLLAIALSGAPTDSRAERTVTHPLSEAHVLQQVVLRIINNYVEPERIRPRLMLIKGLEWVQQTVAEVQVHGATPPAGWEAPRCEAASDCREVQWPLDEPGNFECFEHECLPIPGTLTITADTESRPFSTLDIRGPWDLTARMAEIFGFLDQSLPRDVERPPIEYAAINGMLSTLDPHSNLLVPEMFEEMQMDTRGEFGGLGIVISMHPGPPCSGHLSIMEVIDGSPAESAGLQRMDRIVRIDDQPTDCMDLTEAVNRMRGRPGTSVRLWIERPGERRPRPVNIVRANIQIDSVKSRMLEDGVGYIKIESFQANTSDELREHLERLHSQGMRSLVLDLRDDPGGLLDQAIRVADIFLASGTIVITAGSRPEDRDVRRARPDGTEPNYPIVVLVNGGSASASEIVAGALHNQGRALLVGSRTFGKGSVQTIYQFDDGSALKLTVAQYLTPGERSIQGVGIVPDVVFGTMTVERDRIDLDPKARTIRETDLEQHLSQRTAREGHAAHRLLLLRRQPSTPRAGQCPVVFRCDQDQDTPWSEEAVSFAQQLLTTTTGPSRAALLSAAGRLVAERQEREDLAVTRALRSLHVDWSRGEARGTAHLSAEVTADDHELSLRAGQQGHLRVRVTNDGDTTLYRLRATTRSDNPLLDDLELVFGRLDPGESRTWQVPVCIPDGFVSREDPVTVEFSDLGNHELPTATARIGIQGLERPVFAYGVQLLDDRGNGDGRLQRGEQATLRILVRNTGRGEARDVSVRVKNKAGDQVVVRACRHDIGRLAPGSERVVEADLEVSADFQESSVQLELQVSDDRMRESITERLEIPLAPDGPGPRPAQGVVAVTAEGIPLRQWAAEDAPVVARALANAAFRVTGRTGAFLRVDLGSGRTAWIAESDTTIARRPNRRIEEVVANQPPKIFFDTSIPVAVRAPTFHLEGTVSDPDRVLDMYIYVGRRKPFYLSNRDGRDPHRLHFSVDLPLEGGSNQILVVARETSDLVSRRLLVIRRDNPDGTPIESRDHDDQTP